MKTYTISIEREEALNNSFTYHAPKEGQPEKYTLLRDMARELAVEVLRLVPPGREQSVAITKLEEAIMWANKGIACGEK